MNLLSRVFHGRVAKPHKERQTTTHQSLTTESNTLLCPSRSSIRRRSPRTGHPKHHLSRPRSTSHTPLSNRGRDSEDEVCIKQEHDGDGSFAMAPREEYDDRNNELDDHVGSEDEMDDDDAEVEEVDDEQNTSEEEVNEEDVDEASWNEGDAPEYEDEGKEGMAADDSEALTANEAHSSDNSLSSDEPIPTIENDEENYRPKKESPYLHGRNQLRSNVRLHSDNPQDDIEEGLDEDLEAELEAEMEDGCLIDEADLRDYLKHKRSSPGIHKWPSEACRLYKLLYLRGSYPILPWKWEWPFSRIHPVPAELFTPKDSQDKALIKAEKSDFHGECKPPTTMFQLLTDNS